MNAESVALTLKAWAQEKHLLDNNCLVTIPPGDDLREQIFGGNPVTALSEGILRRRGLTAIAFNNARNEVIVFTHRAVAQKDKKILPASVDQAVSIRYIHGGIAQAGAPTPPGVQHPYVFANGSYACGGSIHPARHFGCGTLGCLVTDAHGEIFGLSNNHVTGLCNYAHEGEKILAPGHGDITANGIDPFTIGYHHRSLPMVNGVPDNVDILANRDAAIIRIADTSKVSSMQGSVYDTPGITVDLAAGQQVEKVGRTTGHTTGTVIGQMAGPYQVGYSVPGVGPAFAFFDPVFVIQGNNGPFSQPGDSGSLITAMIGADRYAVGLVFAGDQQGLAYALPLSPILTTLNVTLVTGHNV